MYNHPYGPGHGGRGPGQDLKGGFATCAAAMVSIVVSPPIYEFTAPFVWDLSRQSYSEEVSRAIITLWGILVYPTSFFAARAAIVASLTMAGVYLSYRLL